MSNNRSVRLTFNFEQIAFLESIAWKYWNESNLPISSPIYHDRLRAWKKLSAAKSKMQKELVY